MQETQLTSHTISYEVPREVLRRVWFLRASFRYHRVRTMVFLLVAATLFYFGTDIREFHYLAFAIYAVALHKHWVLYRGLTAIAWASGLRGPRTLSFSPAGLVITGPNYKSEIAWT